MPNKRQDEVGEEARSEEPEESITVPAPSPSAPPPEPRIGFQEFAGSVEASSTLLAGFRHDWQARREPRKRTVADWKTAFDQFRVATPK